MIRYAVILLLFWCCGNIAAQVGNVPMNRNFERDYILNSFNSKTAHSAVKPLFKEENLLLPDSVQVQDVLPKKFTFSPLSDIRTGMDMNETSSDFAYHLGAGVQMDMQLKNKFNLNAKYMFNYLNGPSYVTDRIEQWGAAPSFGPVSGDSTGYLYHWFEGNLHYKASKHFTFQLGNGKNFIGDGYRSLLLSDVANNYPYFKITTNVWKIKYVNIFARPRHIYGVEDDRAQYKHKYTTTHYLDWNVSKKVNIGFFETIVWQAKDTLLNRGFDFNYINPIIFYRPVEFQQGSADNALMGLNISVDVGKKTRLYGQFMIDEFLLQELKADSGWWANKYGGQIGIKTYDIAGIENLDLQSEFSAVRPFTLSHGAEVQNYGHDNGSLAHPYGANYFEWVNFVNYAKDKWQFELQVNWAVHGEDSVAYLSHGGNIFQSYSNREGNYNHSLLQGVRTDIFYTRMQASYLLSEKFNLWAEVGYIFRNRTNILERKLTNYIYVGLKTNLWNRYTDY